MAYGPHGDIKAIPVVGEESEHMMMFFNIAKGKFDFLPAETKMVFETETGELFTVRDSGNKNIHLSNDEKLLHEPNTRTDKLEKPGKNIEEYFDIYDSVEEEVEEVLRLPKPKANTRTAGIEKLEENMKECVAAVHDNDEEIPRVPNTRAGELQKPKEDIKDCAGIDSKNDNNKCTSESNTKTCLGSCFRREENVDNQIYLGMAENGFYFYYS
ncbi:uncharacterized protein LOC114527586 [Dendronephthya gigantea]|uniref:uncharacterized protein LOC114527586 n=1 Tax=Dendronephthya gigantea TaxID=151771 RepID=UPI00106D9373|nr:uncharacterized protein LOC114527586 [Dendronephthya gigantea]